MLNKVIWLRETKSEKLFFGKSLLELTCDIIFDIIPIMSKFQKLIEKILNDRSISFEEAENVLNHLGFQKRVKGSHHVFFKDVIEKMFLLNTDNIFWLIK